MTASATIALLGTMFAIAIVPGPSDLLIVGRSIAGGFTHGLAVTFGVIAADYAFILVAALSLGILAEQLGALFVVIKFACGLYLIWLGFKTWRSREISAENSSTRGKSWAASFIAGFLITFGDPKAILFYMGLLPAYLDMASVTWNDVLIVMGAATLTIATVKLCYAYLADRARALFENDRARLVMSGLGGAALAGTGGFILLTASQ